MAAPGACAWLPGVPAGGGIGRERVHVRSTGLAVGRVVGNDLSVTSIVLCQQEGGADALRLVFVGEDGEQDTVHGCPVLEGSHGPGPSSYFAESSFDCICRSYLAALILRFVAEAGEQLIGEIQEDSVVTGGVSGESGLELGGYQERRSGSRAGSRRAGAATRSRPALRQRWDRQGPTSPLRLCSSHPYAFAGIKEVTIT